MKLLKRHFSLLAMMRKNGMFVTPNMCRSSSIEALYMDPNDRAADVPGFGVTVT
jgi:hypothetical protein